ncbi:MAG: hypothetical protein HeimC3_43160 [Candidatus Heimdallarchaeota archaeon LC_3]|nr:MAG: hypothetical protein HeimC3_43160 [Candidatus Heimdallarchaeota archaeon LC_3]
MADVNDFFAKNWKAISFIIGILFSYSVLISVGISFIQLNLNESSPFDQNKVIVVIIFESKDITNPIIWDPIIKDINQTVSLFDILNSTLFIEIIDYGSLGFLITGISGIHQYNNYYWQIYKLNSQMDWEYSSLGASAIYINSNSYYRLIFSD